MAQLEQAQTRLRRGLVVVSALTATTLVVWQAVAHADRAQHGGYVACGAVALVCGVTLATVRGSAGTTKHLWLLGAAITLWGIGKLLQAYVTWWNPSPFPVPGTQVVFIAPPLGVIGLLCIPRPTSGPKSTLRLLADSSLLGCVGALLVWLWAPTQMLQSVAERGTTVAIAALMVVAADLTVISMSIMVAMRVRSPALWLTTVGVAAYALAEIVMLSQVISHTTPGPWQISVVWCLAWPVVVWGLLNYHVAPEQPANELDRVWSDPDSRAEFLATVVGLALLVVGASAVAWTLVSASEWGPQGTSIRVMVAVVLVGLAVVILGFREWLHHRLRVELVRRLHREATADPLTGLANRRVLAENLQRLPGDQPWSLVALDIDGFKDFNDILGYSVGDTLLCSIADRLRAITPRRGQVYRINGDEFGLLVPGGKQEAEFLANRVIRAVQCAAIDIPQSGRAPVSASVGIAAVGESPVAGVSADPLVAMSASGVALRMAKSAGRDHVQVFDEGVATVYRRRLSLEERLRHAIAAAEITMDFQPIVRLADQRLAGVESLARWSDAQLGQVSPQEFIPLAEETGLVVALGEHVLHHSLQQMDPNFVARGLRLSCNVSAVQLRVPGFHRVVEDALTTYRFPPEQLLMEVTEAIMIDETGPALATLRRLANSGVRIAIDDFGTGYSSLGYLRRLPATVLKVDRSLTLNVLEQLPVRAITQAVVDVATALELSVVVEGIESPEVAELISIMGVEYGQGTWYGSAAPIDEVMSALNQQYVLPDPLETNPASSRRSETYPAKLSKKN